MQQKMESRVWGTRNHTVVPLLWYTVEPGYEAAPDLSRLVGISLECCPTAVNA
jgi:hypothetical protein